MLKLKVKKHAQITPPKEETHDWELIADLAKQMVNIERDINTLKEQYNEVRKQLACAKYNNLQLGKKYSYRTDKSVVEGILRYRTTYDNRNEYFELQVIKKDGAIGEVVRVVLNPDDLTLIE